MEKKFFLIFSLLFFLIPLFVFAVVPFEDDFQSYNSNASLDGQGGWSAYGFYVRETADGNKFIRSESTGSTYTNCSKTGSPITSGSGIWQMDFFIPSNACTGGNNIVEWRVYLKLFWNGSCTDADNFFGIKINGKNGTCDVYLRTYLPGIDKDYYITSLTPDNSWHKMRLYFDLSSGSVKGGFDNSLSQEVTVSGICGLRGKTYILSYPNYQFDNIKEYIPYQWVQSDYHFDISILKPQNYNCATLESGSSLWNLGVDLSNLEFQGAIKNHSDSPYKLMGMCWYFRDPNSVGDLYCQNFDSPINPGEQKDFYFQFIWTTNPAWVELSDWYIWGYKRNDTDSIYRFPLFGVGFHCAIFFTNSTTPQTINVEGPTTFPSAEEWITPENCDQYESITDRLLCGLKNLLITIFVPSREKMIEFYNLKDKVFKTKIPFNFLSELYSFFSDVKNSLSNPEIKIKLFGKETTFNPNFYLNFPLISDIYKGLKFAFSGVFLFFSLKFLNREAKYFLGRIEL